MTGLVCDLEYAQAIAGTSPAPDPVDVFQVRQGVELLLSQALPRLDPRSGVQQTFFGVRTFDGVEIQLSRFATEMHIAASTPQPVVLAIHGGSFVAGSVDLYAGLYAQLALFADRPFFAVEYRLAPEHRAPVAAEDVHFALKYIVENAQDLNINPHRIGIMGDSSGGGVAAGVALLARDRKLNPPLAKQILVYPMLDDRTYYPPEKEFLKLTTWTLQQNKLSWDAYLGKDVAGKPDANVSEYAAPARAKSLAGLPSTYIDVGSLDIFRDEDIDFAQRLMQDDVEVEFHLWPGLPHGFDGWALGIKWGRKAVESRIKALKSF